MKVGNIFFRVIWIIFYIGRITSVDAKCVIQDTVKNSLNVKRDKINNQIVFYLNRNEQIIDSLILFNLNFKVDSLTKISENIWHYIYSVRCGSNCKLRNQIILIIDSNKLHLSYVSYFSSSFDYSDLYSSPESVNVLPYSIYNCNYFFGDDFFKGKPIVKEYLFKGKVADNGKGSDVFYQLKYDAVKKVYYTQTQLLKGEYLLVIPKKNKQLKKKINEIVPVLKFREVLWLYYNNTWYELNSKKNRLVQFE